MTGSNDNQIVLANIATVSIIWIVLFFFQEEKKNHDAGDF
jgi:hypothetical protein